MGSGGDPRYVGRPFPHSDGLVRRTRNQSEIGLIAPKNYPRIGNIDGLGRNLRYDGRAVVSALGLVIMRYAKKRPSMPNRTYELSTNRE